MKCFAASNVRELIALAKAKPDTLNFASSGNGQSTHLSGELFNAMAGIKLAHVPYKGSAPALTDVIGGQVPLMFDTMLSAMPFVKSGKLKALAVTSPQRSPAAPERARRRGGGRRRPPDRGTQRSRPCVERRGAVDVPGAVRPPDGGAQDHRAGHLPQHLPGAGQTWRVGLLVMTTGLRAEG